MTEQTEPLIDTSAGRVQQASDEAAQRGRQIGSAVGQVMKDQVDIRTTQAGAQVSAMGAVLDRAGDDLRSQGKDVRAVIAKRAAEKVDGVGAYLKQSDADRILSDVENLGSRRPWVLVAAGAAMGMGILLLLRRTSGQSESPAQ